MLADAVELRCTDGTLLAATVWPASGEATATVVLAHGLGAGKSHASTVAMATRLAMAGYSVVAYDGRGHGESGGVCTLGTDEAFDVAAAASFARQLTPAVVAIGASMGGIAVLRHAVANDDLTGIVAVSVPARWRIYGSRSLLAAAMTRTGLGRRMLRRRTGVRLATAWASPPCPEDLAADVTCAAAIVHGSRDRFIPATEASLLYDRLAGPRRIDIVDGMGHGFDPRATDAVIEAVRWVAATTTPAQPAPDPCGPPSPG